MANDLMVLNKNSALAGFSVKDLTSINKLVSRPDPQLNFKWVVMSSMPDVGGVSLPTEYVESVDIPFGNIQVAEGVFNCGSMTYFPGFHDTSAFGLVLYEDDQATALHYILNWKANVKNYATGAYKLPKQYKRDLRVRLLDTKNIGVVDFILEGIWPADTSNYSLQYTSSERLVVSQNFSIDNVQVKLLKKGFDFGF